jgi:monovalent cation:H+ antiporter-2, CPA2 family
MHGAHEYLKAITIVLCVAAVTTVVFQRLRQPVVLGYILAGMIVGPYLPVPLVADRAIIHTLSELGVILLMFSLGLEFSLRKLAQVGPTAALTAVIQSSIMIWIGFLVGRAFGWTSLESMFAGAIIAISSTTIIAKAFDEHGVRGRLRELVVGVLVVEDLIAVLLMAVLTAVSSKEGVSLGTVAKSAGRLAAFLTALLAVGMLVVPRAIRFINRMKRPETTLVASVGICFGISLLAQELDYSVALGAFIAGSLVAESGEEKHIEHLIVPVRDLFAAIFFVSVGMQIDPGAIADHWLAVVVFTAVVIGGKLVGVSLGAFLTGTGTRTAVQAGLSLAQIGEFSFIIAGLGITLGATRDFIYPIAVAVSAITTLTTPWLIRSAGPVASYVDGRLPQRLQIFASLYGTWIERLKAPERRRRARASVRRYVKLLVLDATVLIAIVIGTALTIDYEAAWLVRKLGASEPLARGLVMLGAAVLATPLVIGVARLSRALGLALARAALPPAAKGTVDLAAAPRRALLVPLQLAVVLLVALPVLAVAQPFVAGWAAALVLGVLLVVLGIAFWRSAANLHMHVKAGAQVIVEALAAQGRKPAAGADAEALERIRTLLPGLGEPVPVRLDEESAAVGKTLAELNLRGSTGASVLAIARGDGGVIVPGAGEALRAGDVLAVAGTRDAVVAATELLRKPGR